MESEIDIEQYINGLKYSDSATNWEKTLVAGNIRTFAGWFESKIIQKAKAEERKRCRRTGERIMTDVYHDPEKFGLENVDEIERGGGYDFDIVVVFRHLPTGKFYWATDSGCSCPSPFESFTNGVSDLSALPETLDEFKRVAQDVAFVHKIEILLAQAKEER